MKNSDPMPQRSWQILLIGGPSGVGKSSVSYRLAHYFGIGLTEGDDFQVILEHMTTPEQQPILHYWRTHPEAMDWSPERILEQHLAVGNVMIPALEAVIANHLESRTPIVLEGDYILPKLAVQASFGGIPNQGRVQSVFLYEDDEAQIQKNFLQREPDQDVPIKRARVSWLYGQWLQQYITTFGPNSGVSAVSSRPWHDVFERILIAIQ